MEDGLPDKSTSKLRIRSTEFKIEFEILSKTTGDDSPLIFAEVDVNGELIQLIIFFK